MAIKCFVIFLGSVFFAGTDPLFAGSLAVDLDQTHITSEENATLSVTVEGDADKEPEAPVVEGLQISPAGTSSQYSYINGKSTSSKRYDFSIAPEREGEFSIPSFSLMIDGKKEVSPVLKLKVSPLSSQSTQNSPTNPSDSSGQVPMEVTRSLDVKKVYVGQVVPSVLKINKSQRIRRAELNEKPQDHIKVIRAKEARRNQIQAKDGTVRELSLVDEAIVVDKAGIYKLKDVVIKAEMLVDARPAQRRGRMGGGQGFPFDDFFGGNSPFGLGSQNVIQKSASVDEVTLEVRDLPQKARPPNFDGLVGEFSLAVVKSAPKKASVGESLSLEVRLAGKGSLDGASAPKWESSPQGLKVFPESPKYIETVVEGGGLDSEASFSYALVPNASGTFDLGVMRLSYFDPTEDSYKELKLNLGTIVVEVGANSVGSGTPALTSKDLQKSPAGQSNPDELISNDTTGSTVQANAPWYKNRWFLGTVMFLFSFAAFAGWMFYVRKSAASLPSEKESSYEIGFVRKAASDFISDEEDLKKILQVSIATLEKSEDSSKNREILAELMRSLRSWYVARHQIPLSTEALQSLSLDELLRRYPPAQEIEGLPLAVRMIEQGVYGPDLPPTEFIHQLTSHLQSVLVGAKSVQG